MKKKIEKLKNKIEKIDFMNYIGDRNPFSNEQLNEQICLGIFQLIDDVFTSQDNTGGEKYE